MVIVCYGDSNTWGYDPRDVFGEPYEYCWPDILGKISGFSVRNEGVNGRQIPDYPYAPPSDTDLLAVMLGTNDLLQGATAKEAASRMEAFLVPILPYCPQILLLCPPPMKRGAWVTTDALASESCRLAQEYKLLSARLRIPFVDTSAWGIELAFDGVHFTEEGHHAFAGYLTEAIP